MYDGVRFDQTIEREHRLVARQGKVAQAHDALYRPGNAGAEERCIGVRVRDVTTDVVANEADRKSPLEIGRRCSHSKVEMVATDRRRLQSSLT